MESIPKSMLLTGFGMMLYEGDPDALALEIAKLPAPVATGASLAGPPGLSEVRPAHPRDACTGSGHVLSRIAVRQGWCTGVARATVGSEQMNDRDPDEVAVPELLPSPLGTPNAR